MTSKIASVEYVNHRGERATRQIVPLYLWYGATPWHPEPQWLLRVLDCEKGQERDFAMVGIKAWGLSGDA